MRKTTCWQKGSITAPMLIMSAAFTLVIYGLVFMLANQWDFTFRQTAYDQALSVAEAGIQYYRWHLAHSPNDYQDGTGQPGPYVHTYRDQQGKEVGTYSLEIETPTDGSSIITITSTGWVNDYPQAKRTVTAKYGIPSLARFSHLTNASAWYGQGITIHGRIHSNTGIRMDGVNTSLVTNSQATYKCGQDTGCSPTVNKDGVWGSGPNANLWLYPYPPVDFDAILFDFAVMRDEAVANGVYLPDSHAQGYHIQFLADGRFSVFKVTRTYSNHGYSINEGCRRWYSRIRNEELLGTYQVADNPVIFAEDDVWVDGIVNGRTTVGVASFPLQSLKANIWINDNITYLAKDGRHALGLIAQDDIFFGRDLPDDFEVNAALMAQNGKVMRHGYFDNCGDTPYAVRNSLTIYGSIISNQKSYWNYGDGPTSGFRTRTVTYDANLLYNAPPYFPTDGEYEFISWEER